MILNNIKLEDPLKEKALPLFAKKLNINHFSPTQFSIPDGNWLFKYLVLTQEERRALPSNSQMKAGVAVNNVLQKHLADTIWKFGPQRKLTPMANQEKNKDKQEIIHAELQEFRNHIANDDKDQAKKEKYQDEIFAVCNHGFSALEKLGVATTYPITCEEQISITQEVSSLFLSVVGRTDFTFGGVQEKEGVISAPTPAGSRPVSEKPPIHPLIIQPSPGYIKLNPTMKYAIEARENSATFFKSCVEAFFDLTNPVSNIAKPAAIHITKKPPIRNSNVLNIKYPDSL